ncbi:GWxTD domain-containing protein [Fodinibius sp. Rm-B-1B1-1]|uniref:GWxTD domain-containing protein n=1 Tax=Fodinibius alkaliphilus TaxID=3140241 RepID=UPI00315A517A
MNTFKKYLSSILLFLIIVVFSTDVFAQRNVSYRDLVMRQQQSQSNFEILTLPGNENELVQFAIIFHIPYNTLPFKKNSDRSSENKFYSSMNLMLEVFKKEDASTSDLKKEELSIQGLEPAGRAFWDDTVYAKEYDSTQSNSKFLSSYIKVNLKPGSYNYVLQMKQGDQAESRISRTRQIQISPYDKKKVGNILVSPLFNDGNDSAEFILNASGNAVEYAKDFFAIAYLPQYDDNENYTVDITKLNTYQQDTTRQNTVYSTKLTTDQVKTNVRPQLQRKNGTPYLNLTEVDNGYTYAILEIPNSRFQNSLYRIEIKDGTGNIIARDSYRSQWKDMPTSLLNLDVAIEMLRFIADKKTIRKIDSGSAAEREKKFRTFWEERDPTPDTEFNELMAEYYNRIDYAYNNFSTENTIGYNSDRGEVYIKFGPPQDINRKFPTSGATTEVWTYPNREFIFRATTGFGDFKLVSKQSR